MRPTGYHSTVAGSVRAAGRASNARYPIHHAGRPMPSRNANAMEPLVASASPAAATRMARRAATWVQPIAASMIGSCARLASTNASGEPDMIEANKSADVAPAPVPMRRICIIASCPALRAVRGGSCPPQPSTGGSFHRSLDVMRRAPARRLPGLLDHVIQEAEEARPLDRAGKLTLLLVRDRGDAARGDLA